MPHQAGEAGCVHRVVDVARLEPALLDGVVDAVAVGVGDEEVERELAAVKISSSTVMVSTKLPVTSTGESRPGSP